MVRSCGHRHTNRKLFVAPHAPEPTFAATSRGPHSAFSHDWPTARVRKTGQHKVSPEPNALVVVVVVVVAEWLYYCKRKIIDKRADLTNFFINYRRKMCIVVSRPMTIVTFLRKNGYHRKRVVDSPQKKRHIPKQNPGNRRGF